MSQEAPRPTSPWKLPQTSWMVIGTVLIVLILVAGYVYLSRPLSEPSSVTVSGYWIGPGHNTASYYRFQFVSPGFATTVGIVSGRYSVDLANGKVYTITLEEVGNNTRTFQCGSLGLAEMKSTLSYDITC